MIVHLHKENGHVTDQRTLDSVCGFLPNGDYVATIEPKATWEKRQPRTLNQNALLWIWFADIANFFNKTYGDDHWNKDNVHDLFCEMFRYPVALPNGQVIDKWVETSKLNKRQIFLLVCTQNIIFRNRLLAVHTLFAVARVVGNVALF